MSAAVFQQQTRSWLRRRENVWPRSNK